MTADRLNNRSNGVINFTWALAIRDERNVNGSANSVRWTLHRKDKNAIWLWQGGLGIIIWPLIQKCQEDGHMGCGIMSTLDRLNDHF